MMKEENICKSNKKMTSDEGCEGCPFIDECCKNKKHQKILTRDAVLDEFYAVYR